MSPDSDYELFELQPGASLEELKTAYRDLVKVWHPDRLGSNPRLQRKAEQKLKEINRAYERLHSHLTSSASASTTAAGKAERSAPPPPPPRPQAASASAGTPADETSRRSSEWMKATSPAWFALAGLLAVVAVIVITGAFGVSVSTSSKPPVPKQQEVSVPIETRPANGSELAAPSLQLGLGTLTVVNGTDGDAAVKLVPMHSNQSVRFVYVHANSRWTIGGVPEGSYRLRFTQGRDWDGNSKLFRRNGSYRELDRSFDYVKTTTAGSVRHEVTLHRSGGIGILTIGAADCQPLRAADGGFQVFRTVTESGDVVYTNCPPKERAKGP